MLTWSVRLLRFGPWLLISVGIVLIGTALIGHAAETSLCLGLVGLGVVCIMAGVTLPRAAGRVSLRTDGVEADLVDVRELESSVAAIATEVAEKAIPDDHVDKASIVRAFTEEAVQSWGSSGSLVGTWWEVLEAHHREPRKIDVVEVILDGEEVKAIIRRTHPAAQSERRWEFVGKVRGNFLFGMFFTTTPDISGLSYGTIQLRRADQHGTLWVGFYVRLEIRSDREGWSEQLEPIEMSWQRHRPEDR